MWNILVQYIYKEFGLSTGVWVEYFDPVYVLRCWFEHWHVCVCGLFQSSIFIKILMHVGATYR